MSLLFRLVYATHANGTHHKLAMDALRHLKCEKSESWRRLILKHSETYLEGSKAPDKEFKDFKNHVLHVGDNFWGGAPEKAQSWYNQLVTALKQENWEEAVYAAGVLSHYYTDPIEPLHTAQSEAENNVHRAVEWSISKSYAELRKIGDAEFSDVKVEAGQGKDWVGDMVREGATTSNQYYQKLITHYDYHRGVVHPPEGLDKCSREFLAMLLRYAAVGFAAILDRAFAESAITPPKVMLTPQTFMATLKIPVRWVTNKLEDAADQKLVQAMYDELQATGTVEDNLDEDDRAVRDLHAVEVLKQKPRSRTKTAEKTKAKTGAKATAKSSGKKAQSSPKKQAQQAAKADVKKVEAKKVEAKKIDTSVEAQSDTKTKAAATMAATVAAMKAATTDEAKSEKLDKEAVKRQADKALERIAAETKKSKSVPLEELVEPIAEAPVAEYTDIQYYLQYDDNVVDAPSIGRKTAKKLNRAGVFRVEDLLEADPDELTDLLNLHYINAETIIDWQDQARLCCEIPRLRGGNAQLLVAAGYRDSVEIAKSDPRDIHPDIAAFCETEEGQKLNRGGDAPTLTDVGDWISRAYDAKMQKAA